MPCMLTTSTPRRLHTCAALARCSSEASSTSDVLLMRTLYMPPSSARLRLSSTGGIGLTYPRNGGVNTRDTQAPQLQCRSRPRGNPVPHQSYRLYFLERQMVLGETADRKSLCSCLRTPGRGLRLCRFRCLSSIRSLRLGCHLRDFRKVASHIDHAMRPRPHVSGRILLSIVHVRH